MPSLWQSTKLILDFPWQICLKASSKQIEAYPTSDLTPILVGDMKLTTIVSNLLANDQKIVQIAEGLKRKVLTASKK